MKDKYFIFDMDGTLYQFDKSRNKDFGSSIFYSDLRQNIYQLFVNEFGFTESGAIDEYQRIKEKYGGEVSLGVEKEHQIDRYKFFEKTWNLNPEYYLEKNTILNDIFNCLEDKVAVLTAAPKIWAEKALTYLGIYEFVKDKLFTGEPDLRKPNLEIFRRVAKSFGTEPENVYSIGDQEYSDIIPAKQIGMKTIIVGSKSKHADYQINTIDELLPMLEGLK